MTHREVDVSGMDIRYDEERDGVWIGDEVFLPRSVVVTCLARLAEGNKR